MPEIYGHLYDEVGERLEVRFRHPVAGDVARVYRKFSREKYDRWWNEGFHAHPFFFSFMDEHDEERPLAR